LIGDPIVAEGGLVSVNGLRFLSAHTLTVEKGLTTRDAPNQPDYVIPGEAEFDLGAFPRQRARARFLGNSTLPDSQLDIFALRMDPRDNLPHEDIVTSTVGNPRDFNRQIGGGGGIWRVFLDVDFLGGLPIKPSLSPCTHLFNAGIDSCPQGGTLAEEFSLLAPVPREIVVRSRHKKLFPNNITLDLNGNEAPNGEFLMPLGIGLGGFEIPVPDEFDLNFGIVPIVFEAFPWMLDRRLSPGGCLDTGCELNPQPLAPFPVSKIDPRGTDNLVPAAAADRVITYFTAEAGGLVPHLITSFPPVNSCTPGPTAFPDSAQVDTNGTVTLGVLLNDLGTLNPSTVQITTQPAHGVVAVNPDGTITFIASSGFAGADSFTYRVANTSGVFSAPAVVSLTLVDALTVAAAEYRIFLKQWTLTGTTNARVEGNTIQVFAGATIASPSLGTAPIDALSGRWSLVLSDSTILPSGQVSIQAATGGKLENVTVTINN
jgi:hypothetical protein